MKRLKSIAESFSTGRLGKSQGFHAASGLNSFIPVLTSREEKLAAAMIQTAFPVEENEIAETGFPGSVKRERKRPPFLFFVGASYTFFAFDAPEEEIQSATSRPERSSYSAFSPSAKWNFTVPTAVFAGVQQEVWSR